VAACTEVVRGDVLDADSLSDGLRGVDVAYYLVHSMGSKTDFEKRDRQGATNFARAAREAGVRRIIYLGGLAEPSPELSPHLRSRHEVGDILRTSGCQVIELRASVVIGSGSLSFELVRSLVERLPIMITPKWTTVEAQPIAIRDLTAYLMACRTLEVSGNRTFEVGGADRVSYEGLMREYARQRGLRRFMIRVPMITPWLSSLWLGLVTPVFARIGRKLIESIKNPSVVRDPSALHEFDIEPCGMETAIARALEREEQSFVESRWYDALSSGGEVKSWAGVRFGNRIADRRTTEVELAPAVAFDPIRRLGGKTGWYANSWLWTLRGDLDLLVGGVGTRRGRVHPNLIRVGDALDFWRVEAFEPDRLLRLSAEMKLPGRAWLEFEVKPKGSGSVICQTALFDPVGLCGLAYWYLVYPLHAMVFGGMLRGIVREGRRHDAAQPPPGGGQTNRRAAGTASSAGESSDPDVRTGSRR
jgi:uncharacterized protein YbjT (DUF2867 family)